jgi:GNAT superfamily N-acetyltransferase
VLSRKLAPPMDFASRLQEVLRTEGFGGVVVRAIRKAESAVLRIEQIAFYEYNLTRPVVRLRPPSIEVEFIVAMPDDLLKDFDIGPQEVRQRLARSHVALLALHDGVVIAMLWLAFNSQQVSEIGRQMVLSPGEVLTYNECTLAEWRGHGVSPHLNQFAHRFAMLHGASRRINWRRLGNAPAIRVANKLGDRPFAVVTTAMVLGVPQVLVFGAQSPQLLELLRPATEQAARASHAGGSEPTQVDRHHGGFTH